ASGSVPITDGVTTNVPTCISSGTAHFVVTNCATSSPVVGATVTVDSTVVGTTSASGVLDVPLPPGGHAWALSRPNYATKTGNITISDNVTSQVAQCLTPTCNEVTAFSQNFDGVTAPALPAGWSTTVVSGPTPAWASSNSGSPTPVADTAPTAMLVDEPT